MDLTDKQIRMMIASEVLAGLLACPEFDIGPDKAAGIAVRYADALIAELKKPDAPKEINNG